jgi:hypothetical protein
MSLGGSINHFCRKYKKPLTILVLVFFVYKLFSYYGTVYEGNTTMGENKPLVADLRVKADAAKKLADEAKIEADNAIKKADNAEKRLREIPKAAMYNDERRDARDKRDRLKIIADQKNQFAFAKHLEAMDAENAAKNAGV